LFRFESAADLALRQMPRGRNNCQDKKQAQRADRRGDNLWLLRTWLDGVPLEAKWLSI
jgi:hypothetical protein